MSSCDSDKQKQSVQTALSRQKIYDAAPIYTDVLNFAKPAFIPKTILSVKGEEESPELRQKLKLQMEEILAMDNYQRCDFLNQMIGEEVLTKKECLRYKLPLEMIGQKGIYAKKNIKKHTVLGFYSGIYVKGFEDIKILCQDFTAAQLSLYTFGFAVSQYPYIVGYKYGNKLCLINGATTYKGTAEEIAREYCLRNNLVGLYAKSGENPDMDYLQKPDAYDLVAYITEKDIKKGEQLFIDYGRRYWKEKIQDNCVALEEDILKFIGQYKKKTHKANKFF